LDQVDQSVVGRRRSSPVGIGSAVSRTFGSTITRAIRGPLGPAIGAVAVRNCQPLNELVRWGGVSYCLDSKQRHPDSSCFKNNGRWAGEDTEVRKYLVAAVLIGAFSAPAFAETTNAR
jgi:hypothetical protein